MAAIADVSALSIAQFVSLGGRAAVVTGGGRGLGKRSPTVLPKPARAF